MDIEQRNTRSEKANKKQKKYAKQLQRLFLTNDILSKFFLVTPVKTNTTSTAYQSTCGMKLFTVCKFYQKVDILAWEEL